MLNSTLMRRIVSFLIRYQPSLHIVYWTLSNNSFLSAQQTCMRWNSVCIILYVQNNCAVWLSQGLYNWSFFSVVFFLRGFVDTYRMSAERASQLINLHRPSMSSTVIIHLRTAVNSKTSVTWHTFPLKPMASQLLKHRV